MAKEKTIKATEETVRYVMDLLMALQNIQGTGTVEVSMVPGVGITIHGRPQKKGRNSEFPFLWVKLEAAGANGDGWYTGREVALDTTTATQPTWVNKTNGRTFGITSDDEGEIVHPHMATNLENVFDGTVPAVYMVTRLAVSGQDPIYQIVGDSFLPTKGSQYMVLQLTGTGLLPAWDWPRAHA